MRHLKTTVDIAAPPARVWDVLTDLSRYAEWNPHITEASGRVQEGEQLVLHMQRPNGSSMTFKPRVLRARPPVEFRWLGRLLLPGIFDGEHIFELSEQDDGTHLVHREEFRGILVGPLWKQLDSHTRHGFEAMNQALKERAEAANA